MQQQGSRGKPSQKQIKQFIRTPAFKIFLAVFLFFSIGSSATFLYFYNYYSRIIDRRLSGEVFKRTARIYGTPYRIHAGQSISLDQITTRLLRAGYEQKDTLPSDDGFFEISGSRLTVLPKSGPGYRIEFRDGRISRIVRGRQGDIYETKLPPELVTTLYDESRQKRRLLESNEIPKVVENAVVAAEDQRFYSHFGLDPIRIAGSVISNLRRSDRLEGGSTITQQLAGSFFLDRSQRTYSRKIPEAFIALLLEQRLTKQQILAMYLNEVYLGQRGSFAVHGFGEAAAAFFGRDLQQLTLPEAATIAGVIPAPNAFSPNRNPERAKTRRNLVLSAMRDMEYISEEEMLKARESDLTLAPFKVDASDAPYFIDYVRDQLLRDFTEEALTNDSLRIYTTIDPDLQKAAVEAVEKGIAFVDEQIAARQKLRRRPEALPVAQASLIVLDPHTGEIKAMVGGRDYGASQYNRIVEAFRQPGSIFKPFVYAAAYESVFPPDPEPVEEQPADPQPEASGQTPQAPPALPAPPVPAVVDAAPIDVPQPPVMPLFGSELITPITTVIDEPTTFVYETDKIYEPNNYKQSYQGTVSLRTALQKSLNVPTVKLAERIGYERVAAFTRRAGLNAKIRAYPSIALGAFEVTPIEMAAAYTIFANDGIRMEPHAVREIHRSDGKVQRFYTYEPKTVIRPELAYLMTYLMEGVIDSGTGAGVRSRGFHLPAAGKTGTSRDGWFAGYTKDLLAIAWVGYDDNRDINLEGARSALPIWTEFMLRATKLYPPRDPDAVYFEPPPGIEFVRMDDQSLMPATPLCISTFQEAFIAGTAPKSYCPLHPFKISSLR